MHTPHIFKKRLAALLPVLVLGCATAAPESARSLSERTSAVLARAPSVYAPAAAEGAATRETETFRAIFEGALTPEAKGRVRHDPALDLVATAVAENFSDQGRSASWPLVQWLLWKSGSVATYSQDWGGWWGASHSTRRSGGEKDAVSLDGWAVKAAETVNAMTGRHVSFGIVRFTAGKIMAESLVVGFDHFEAKSFSKTYAPGGPLTLALKPRTPLKELHFLLDKGDVVEEQTLPARDDGSFFLSQAVPTKPGRYFIEIQGPGPRRATLLTLPIYVGVPEPTTPDEFIQNPPAGPSDPNGWQTWLASTYDAERAKLGKAPVEVDARLGAMATKRSLEIATGQPGLVPAGLTPAEAYETDLTIQAADSVLLHLLRPSARRRFVLADRVLFGAGASPRPVSEKGLSSFSLVQETVSPATAAPAGSAP